jgi:hypothetical protein
MESRLVCFLCYYVLFTYNTAKMPDNCRNQTKENFSQDSGFSDIKRRSGKQFLIGEIALESRYVRFFRAKKESG